MMRRNSSWLISPSPSRSASSIISCNSSSDRFSPNSFATLFRFLNDIFPEIHYIHIGETETWIWNIIVIRISQRRLWRNIAMDRKLQWKLGLRVTWFASGLCRITRSQLSQWLCLPSPRRVSAGMCQSTCGTSKVRTYFVYITIVL